VFYGAVQGHGMIHMGDDGHMNQVPTELWLSLATSGMADLFEFDEFLSSLHLPVLRRGYQSKGLRGRKPDATKMWSAKRRPSHMNLCQAPLFGLLGNYGVRGWSWVV
jgi:hypothetical protein